MITVTMKLQSALTRANDATLVEIVIANDGTGTAARGHYDYTIKGRGGRTLKNGRIENWPRQAKTACALLQRVINNAYPKGV